MREFIRGCRRKAGCTTLVMALVASGMWLRSYVAVDWGHLSTGSINVGFQSFDGYLYLYANRGPGFYSPIRWGSQPLEAVGVSLTANASRWRNPLIPFWSFTIPLTLLSAYLILWTPRKRKAEPEVHDARLHE